MGKTSNRSSAEQLREYRLKQEQLAREKQKKQNRMMLWILCGVLAFAILATGVGFGISAIAKRGAGSQGNPIIDPTNPNYTAAESVTDLVRLTVRYTDENNKYRQGEIIVQLNANEAPITVANFQQLVSEHFYDGVTFHRIYAGFMIQGGDPQGNGMGGSGKNITGEFTANGINNTISHKRGVISMARSSQSYNSASSQFFIMHADNTGLDGQYAAFGEVVSGMDTVDGIAGTEVKYNSSGEKSSPTHPVTIVKAEFVNKIA